MDTLSRLSHDSDSEVAMVCLKNSRKGILVLLLK